MRTPTWLVAGVGLGAALMCALRVDAVAVDGEREPRDSPSEREVTVTVADASDGAPLTARIQLARDALLGETRTLIAEQGVLRTQLSPGSYTLVATHGPEWSIGESRLEVNEGEDARLHVPLLRLVDGRDYTACDLHVHTDESPDSDLSLEDRAATLAAEDIHFAVITDHNHVTPAVAVLAAHGVSSLPGVEVTTWDPEFGHFNAFPRHSAPRYARSSPRGLLRELGTDPDTFVQINHPRLEHHIGYFELAGFDRGTLEPNRDFPLTFDAVEVWNGYDLSASERRDAVFLDWLSLLARNVRISATGGSDAHRKDQPPQVGYPRTYVYVPRAHASDTGRVLRALKQGRSFVTNGPLIDLRVDDDHGPGDVLRAPAGTAWVTVNVDLRAPAWMQLSEVAIWSGDRIARRASLAGVAPDRSGSVRLRLRVAIAGARTLVATVRGEASMKPLLGRRGITPFAFTNPLWITES